MWFASVDLTNPQSLNWYGYSMNDPCSLTDPLGLSPCSIDIAFTSSGQLSGPQLSAAQAQINTILQAASNWLPQGDSLSANFDFSGKVDFVASLTSTQRTPVPYNPSYPLGQDFGSTANVYLNTIAANFAGYGVSRFGPAFGRIVGDVAAHELGHYAFCQSKHNGTGNGGAPGAGGGGGGNGSLYGSGGASPPRRVTGLVDPIH